MNVIWASGALEDYHYWHATDPRIADKINRLIADIKRSPFRGIGKPEPLKSDWAGWWARRIDKEHRFIYRIVGKRGPSQRLEIAQCRFHY